MAVLKRPNGAWGAKVYRYGKQVWLGTFATEAEARRSITEAGRTWAHGQMPTPSRSSTADDPIVYFVRAESGGPIKIGLAHRLAVASRVGTLQVGNPKRLVMVATLDGGRDLEAELHERFAESRIRGEWFEPSPDLLALVAAEAVDGGESVARCWFAQFADAPCDGPWDRAHLITQQRLRQNGLDDLAIDPRSWVPGCRKHHHAFDNKFIRLELADYPPEFREFAEENDLYFDGPERGWKVAA